MSTEKSRAKNGFLQITSKITNNNHEIQTIRREILPLTSLQINRNGCDGIGINDDPPLLDSIVNKTKRRRKRDTAYWNDRQRKIHQSSKQCAPLDGRITKQRRKRQIKQPNLTSPQRASLRQMISKRKISMLEPLQYMRTVEFVQDLQYNRTYSNKIVFASALGLLPVESGQTENDDEMSESVLEKSEVVCDVINLNHRQELMMIMAYESIKKRVDIVNNALVKILQQENQMHQVQISEKTKSNEDTHQESGRTVLPVSKIDTFPKNASMSSLKTPLPVKFEFAHDENEMTKQEIHSPNERIVQKNGFCIRGGKLNGKQIKVYASSVSLSKTIDEVARGYTFNTTTGKMELISRKIGNSVTLIDKSMMNRLPSKAIPNKMQTKQVSIVGHEASEVARRQTVQNHTVRNRRKTFTPSSALQIINNNNSDSLQNLALTLDDTDDETQAEAGSSGYESEFLESSGTIDLN